VSPVRETQRRPMRCGILVQACRPDSRVGVSRVKKCLKLSCYDRFRGDGSQRACVDASGFKPVVVGRIEQRMQPCIKTMERNIRRHAEIHALKIYRNTGMDGQRN